MKKLFFCFIINFVYKKALIMFFAIQSPFLLPFFLGRKIKGEKNNQSRDFKACLSARSKLGIAKSKNTETFQFNLGLEKTIICYIFFKHLNIEKKSLIKTLF